MRRIGLISGMCLLMALAACGDKKNKEKPKAKAPKVEAPKAEAPKAPKAEAPATSASILIAHEVEDFDKWKAAFDADVEARKAAGAMWHSVSRDVENENKVYVHIVGTDLAKLQAFAGSEDLQKAMKEAGVKGAPEIWFANDISIDSPRAEVEGETFSMIGRHEVEDFDKWKKHFDGDAEHRKAMGVLGGSLSRAVDNPNMIVFHMMVKDPKKMMEGMGSDEMMKKMAEAGVKGPPEMSIAKDVEISRYK